VLAVCACRRVIGGGCKIVVVEVSHSKELSRGVRQGPIR
jgi:hypothetical protein